MNTNFFEHETVPQNSTVSPVESLAIEVGDAFSRLASILNTTSVLPSLSSVIGSYLLLDINYHGFENEYTESYSIEQSTKDIVLSTEPTDIISVSYLNITTNTEVYLDNKLPSQEFTAKNQFKVIGKVLSLSGDFSDITLKVKYRGIRKEFGNLKLKPNVIKNSNNTYHVPLIKQSGTDYKVTYDVNLSTNFERIFGSTTIDPSRVFLLIKDNDQYKNIAYSGTYVSGNTLVFSLYEALDDQYDAVVYISNTSISSFLEAFYKEFINHSHDKSSSEQMVNHSDLTDLYKNTSTIFYKDLGITNYDHPQYLNREGYNSSLTAIYENAMLGDLFLASKINEYDQDYKTLLKNSNSILFGDPVRGSKIYYDSAKKAITLLSGNSLNGLNIETGVNEKALLINNTSYLQEDANSLKIHGKNNIVEVIARNTSEESVLKSQKIVGTTSVETPSVSTSELDLGNVLISKDGDNVHASVKDTAIPTKYTSSVNTEYENLHADAFNAKDILLKDGDKISVDEETYLTKKENGFNIVSKGNNTITSSGLRTGLSVGKVGLGWTVYTADYLGQTSSQIDTGVYIETPSKTDTYHLQSTTEELTYGTNKYKFGELKDGYTTIESLKDWRRSNIHAGDSTFYSINLKTSDSVKKNGLVIGNTKFSVIGPGLDCPVGMTLLESADTVSIIKPLPEDQIECSDVSYQNLNAGDTQVFGNLSVDDSVAVVENITAGESLIGRTLAISEVGTIQTLNVQKESVFSGPSEFNGAVSVLNRVSITGSTDIGGSLTSTDISTENYANIGGTLTVDGQTILNNNVIVEGRIRTSGGFTTTGSIESDSLKTGPIEAQTIHSVGGLTAEGNVKLTGPTQIDGSLAVNGNALIQGSLEATSEFTANSLYVTDSTVMGGRLTVSGSAILEGQSITIGKSGSSITLTGNLQFDAPTTTLTGDVRIFKQLDVAQDLNVSGNIKTSSTLSTTNLQVSSSATVDGLLKADSGEFNRKTYFVEGLKANGDSEFTRLRATESTLGSTTTTTLFVNDALTMGPDSTIKTERLITSEFSQTSAASNVLFSGPSQFLSPVKILSKIIIGNEAIENGRNTSGVLLSDREIIMGNNSLIKATKIFATKGLPIGSNQDKNAGFCFEAASNNGGTDGDTGFFATTGQGSGIDGSDLEFWIDGARKGVISKNKVAYNSDSTFDQHIVNIEMLKDAIADIESKLTQMNKATGDRFWPINSIFTTMDERNPYEIMGFGTWIKFAPGRTLVGSVNDALPGGQVSGGLISPAGFDLKVAGSSYGDFTHTLAIAEMPSHKHRYTSDDQAYAPGGRTGRHMGNDFSQKGSSGSADEWFTTMEFPEETGGDKPHNNVQPSIVVHMWRRIA